MTNCLTFHFDNKSELCIFTDQEVLEFREWIQRFDPDSPRIKYLTIKDQVQSEYLIDLDHILYVEKMTL